MCARARASLELCRTHPSLSPPSPPSPTSRSRLGQGDVVRALGGLRESGEGGGRRWILTEKESPGDGGVGGSSGGCEGGGGGEKGMLSRKKTRADLSKPGEVQGKYVIKETSPLLRSELRPARGRRGATREEGKREEKKKHPLSPEGKEWAEGEGTGESQNRRDASSKVRVDFYTMVGEETQH